MTIKNGAFAPFAAASGGGLMLDSRHRFAAVRMTKKECLDSRPASENDDGLDFRFCGDGYYYSAKMLFGENAFYFFKP